MVSAFLDGLQVSIVYLLKVGQSSLRWAGRGWVARQFGCVQRIVLLILTVSQAIAQSVHRSCGAAGVFIYELKPRVCVLASRFTVVLMTPLFVMRDVH